jgi:hypothetical protein
MLTYKIDTEKRVGTFDGHIKIVGTGKLSRKAIVLILTNYLTDFGGRPPLLISIGSGITEMDSMRDLDFGVVVFSPNSTITSLPIGCFKNVSADKIYLPARLENIPSACFDSCSNLVLATIPASVKGVGFGAFSNCTALKEMNIPSGVRTLGEHVFSSCSSLKEITFSPRSSLESIGKYAFTNTALVRLHLPLRVTQIGAFAIAGVPTLQTLAMDFGQWKNMYHHLEPGVPRYIYFYGGVVYLNQTNDEDDLVDSKGRGARFFGLDVYRDGEVTYYDEDVSEEEAKEVERVRAAKKAKMKRIKEAEEAEKAVVAAQAVRDAAKTAAGATAAQVVVDDLQAVKNVQQVLDDALDARDLQAEEMFRQESAVVAGGVKLEYIIIPSIVFVLLVTYAGYQRLKQKNN